MITEILGYAVEDGVLLNAPCGCYACDTDHQQGHRYCDVPTKELLDAEEKKFIYRSLDNSSWRWRLSKYS